MRLIVVGCSGSFAGPDSAASCYLIEAPYEGRTFRLLLDLGSGALGPLQRYAELDAIDAVAVSHLHADHCIDLCGYYVVRKYHPDGQMPPIPVYGPPDTGARLARAYGLDETVGMEAEFDFIDYPEAPFELGPFTVSVTVVDHPVTAYAIRVSHGGRALVYSGDTGPCASLDELTKGCDLLLCEAAFVEASDNPQHLHLTGKEAALVAENAAVEHLVLTHIPPWHSRDQVLAEAKPYFNGVISMAEPGATYDV